MLSITGAMYLVLLFLGAVVQPLEGFVVTSAVPSIISWRWGWFGCCSNL